MELLADLAPDALTFAPSFVASDFPDLRLFRRAQRTQEAMLQGMLRRGPSTAALRKGTLRFVHNRRLSAEQLLTHSVRHSPHPWRDAAVLLSCEDSTHTRFDASDAGPLLHGQDLGYVAHLSFGVLPGTAKPCAWLGARVWTRADVPWRDGDHATRPPAERESSKWPRLRAQVLREARAAGFKGRLISINDREGDAWVSLCDAVAGRHELLTRCTQNRRLQDGGKLFPRLHARPVAAEVTLTLHTRTRSGRIRTRRARVEVRWAWVTLRPPKSDPWAEPTPLTLVGIELWERQAPRGSRPWRSRLLSTCAVRGVADVLDQVGWYGDRWGVEVGNDLLKNALELEGLALREVAACERALALAGPVAAQAARWVALARQSPPVAVERVFEAATLSELGAYARYLGLAVPAVWTARLAVAMLGRMGGADVRPSRPPGWRVVLRGWQRFEQFRAIRAFTREEPQGSERPHDALQKRLAPKGDP